METTRASLLLRLRDHDDQAAWVQFDRIYRPILSRFAAAMGLRADAVEDVVQQCMEAVAKHIRSFDYDPTKGRFKSWLRTMVQNKVRNTFRERHELSADSGRLTAMPSNEDSPEEVFERFWMQEHLWHCLRELRGEVEEKTYLAFERYVLEQKPVDEVARELGMTTNLVYTIKWRLTDKVAAKMKELLNDADQSPADMPDL